MQPLDYLRTQVALRFLDAVATSPLRPPRRASALLRQVWSPQSSNYDRTGSAVQLLDALLPGTARRVSGGLRTSKRLPFRDRDALTLVGYGAGATVYALGEGRERRALKVYRRSLGRDVDGALAIAADYRAQYERIRGWYADLPDLLPEARFLLLHGPILGLRAACSLQDWVAEERRDVFDELAGGTLDERLADDVRRFGRRTLDVWRQEEQCVDVLGEDNLVCVPGPHGPRLRLIDAGILRLERSDPRSARLEERLARLVDG